MKIMNYVSPDNLKEETMSNAPRLDKNTYETSKKFLEETMQYMADAGRRLHDFSDFVLEKFGDEYLPYLEHYYRDIREGKVSLQGMTQPVKSAFFGIHVSAGERDKMIREAAYLRAEQRGFSSGSDYDDWLYAEKQIDEQLAKSAGLVEKGRKGVSSLTGQAEEELSSLKSTVTQWLEAQRQAVQEPAASNKKTTETKPKPAAGKAKAAPKKAAKKTATAKKSAPKKKAAAKKKSPSKA
jgi:hypothetical protein